MNKIRFEAPKRQRGRKKGGR